MEKKRVVWVDLARFFCMIAVMSEHSPMMTDLLDNLWEPWFLNLFSFVAGYVYLHRPGFGSFVRRKLRQLLVPWAFFSFLIVLLSAVFSFGEHNIRQELIQNLLQIRYHGGEMWYVAALFVAFLPFYWLVDRYERSGLRQKDVLFLLVALFLAVLSDVFSHYAPRDLLPWGTPELPTTLPWHLEYMFHAMFYMFLGYLFRLRWEPVFDRHNSPLLCAGLLALYLAMLFVFYPVGSLLFPGPGIPRLYLRSFVSIGAVVSLCKLIPGTGHMKLVGANTLVYYGLHGKVESLIRAAALRLCPGLWETLLYSAGGWQALAAVFIAWLTSWLLVPAVWIFNRWFPVLVGKKAGRAARAGVKS